MKWLLIFFVLIPTSILAQNTLRVDKIIFQYSHGSSWSESGVYSTTEIIEISRSTDKIYVISKYMFIKKGLYNIANKSTFRADTIYKRIKKNCIINEIKIERLAEEINTNRDNFTAQFIIPRVNKPTAKQINELAHHFKIDPDFDTQKIEDFYRVDSFIAKKKPNIAESMVVTDVWDNLRMYLICKEDTTRYDSQLLSTLGQPFFRSRNHNFANEVGVINLEINNRIAEMLPENSELKKRISINSFTRDYIIWCFDNQW